MFLQPGMPPRCPHQCPERSSFDTCGVSPHVVSRNKRTGPFVGSVRLGFIVASCFFRVVDRMAGEELSLFCWNNTPGRAPLLTVSVFAPGVPTHSFRSGGGSWSRLRISERNLRKKGSLERLREEITRHVAGGTILNTGSSATNVVGDEVVTNLDMTSLLPTGLSPIVRKEHGTLIVLEHHIVGHVKTQRLQERSYPQRKGHRVVYPN